jgi:CheY-like chemotaxis protein
MDGLELCRRLRERTANSDLPVIVLTARAELDYGHRARRAGCDRYLEKPQSPLCVLHEVEKLIGPAPPGAMGSPPTVEA